jgi:hypothetical protein
MKSQIELGAPLQFPITMIGYLGFEEAVVKYPSVCGAGWRVAFYLDRHACFEGSGSALVSVCYASIDEIADSVGLPASQVGLHLRALADSQIIASLDDRHLLNRSTLLRFVIAGY